MRAFVLLGVCVCVWKQEPVSGRVDLVFVFFLIPPPYDYFNICPKKNVTRETFFSFFLSTNFDSDKGERRLSFFTSSFASSPLSSHSNQPTHDSTYTQPCLSLPIKESPSASGSTDASTSCTLVGPHQPKQPTCCVHHHAKNKRKPRLIII